MSADDIDGEINGRVEVNCNDDERGVIEVDASTV